LVLVTKHMIRNHIAGNKNRLVAEAPAGSVCRDFDQENLIRRVLPPCTQAIKAAARYSIERTGMTSGFPRD